MARISYLIQLLEGLNFERSRLGCWMTAIKLGVELVASDSDLVGIDNDDVAPHVHGGAVARLVLSSASNSPVLLDTDTHQHI